MSIKRIGVAINTQHMHAEDHQLYSGIREYSRAHPDFYCVLAPFAADDLAQAAGSEPPFDGILAQATPELVKLANQAKVPVVDVWFDSTVVVPISCVFPDFAAAGRAAGQHLVSRGFEHFGYVVNRRIQSQAVMCDGSAIGSDALGFQAYITGRGYPCNQFIASRVVDARAGVWRHWSKRIYEWIAAQPKPLGLFVPNDLLCRHIADIAPELGLNVPYDLGLVCADNEPNLCRLTRPSLSAVDLGYRRVGFEAAALLHRMLQEKFKKRQREILYVEAHTLHARRSTDATAVKDPMVASAMHFILEHSHEGIGVGDVVNKVMTTRRTLERRFREVLDRTVMQEITRCRIERLKRRLAESNTPIKLLALNSGFNSVRVLYETFVREEGISPSAYREKRRGKSKP